LLELITTLRIFISCVERYPNDAVAGAVATRALAPLAQATELCVRGVLEEYHSAASTGNVVTLLSAVWFIREFCEASSSALGLVRQHGGPELLGPALLNPGSDDRLLQEAVRLLHCLQGAEGLLMTIPQVLKTRPRVLTQLLWRLRERSREALDELQVVPPRALLQAAMSSIEAHPEDAGVHDAALALLADLLAVPDYRAIFAEVGGWPYVVMMMEARRDNADVQRRGLQILCELQRGSAFRGPHADRVAQVVMQMLEHFHTDSKILEWGAWLLLELGNLRAVLKMLEHTGEASAAGLGALQALHQVKWGQTEGADMTAIVEVVRVVGPIMLRASQSGRSEVLNLGLEVLHSVTCAAASATDESLPADVAQARMEAVSVQMEVLRQRHFDVDTVDRCMSVVEIFQLAPEGSQLKRQIRDSLFTEGLVQRLAEQHALQDRVQRKVLWAHGVVLGPRAVLSIMERLAGSLPCMVAGVKTLGKLFDDLDELDATAREARALTVEVLTRAMQTWPKEVHLLTHSCFALSALAAHGLDTEGGSYTAEHLKVGLQVAWKRAGEPAQELDLQPDGKTKARYLREELLRLEIESVKVAGPNLLQSLQSECLRAGTAEAQCKALLRDAQSMEPKEFCDHLRLALVGLGIAGRAEHIVEVLRQGLPWWQPTVQAAAEASVELSRLGLQSELQRAGWAEAARGVRERWQQSGGRMDAATQEALSALQFAEAWVGGVGGAP